MISKITEHLYIGEYSDIVGLTTEETKSRLEQIKTLGIGHVISLCPRIQITKEAEAFKANSQNNNLCIWLHHSPIPVNSKLAGQRDPFKVGLELSLNEINAILLHEPNTKILIHCTGGIDRAPFVVASYLVRVCGLELADAYRQIKKVRPCVCEHYDWAWWTDSKQ
jgi:protein tyrosine/serine phosphatase